MIKKTAPVSGKRCLSDGDTPESGAISILNQDTKKRKEKNGTENYCLDRLSMALAINQVLYK